MYLCCFWDECIDKSLFLYSVEKEDDQLLRDHIVSLFPYKMSRLQDGFKYLGFFLNPNGYGKSEWCWLLKRIDKRISN